MDPLETYKTVIDKDSDDWDGKARAALDLLVWLAKGGNWEQARTSAPHSDRGTWTTKIDAIFDCEQVLIGSLERAQSG